MQSSPAIFAREHKALELTALSSGSFRVEVISDRNAVWAGVLDSTGRLVSELQDAPKREFKQVGVVYLKYHEIYYIVVATTRQDHEIPFRVGVFGLKQKGLGLDDSRTLTKLKSGVFELQYAADFFESKKARYFQIGTDGLNIWYRVRVHSNDFNPTVWLLDDSDDNVEEATNDSPYQNTADYLVDPSWNVRSIVVATDNETGPSKFSLSVDSFRNDPRPIWVTRVRMSLGDPLWGTLFNVLVTSILGLTFYILTIRRKKIYYKVLADIPLVNDTGDPILKPIIFTRKPGETDARPLYCGSLFEIRIWNAGHLAIEESASQNILGLTLTNVKSIRSIRQQMSEKVGWREPRFAVSGLNRIELPFIALERGDSIIVTMICEQDQMGPILPVLDRLPGVHIQEYVSRYSSLLGLTTLTLSFLLLPFVVLALAIDWGQGFGWFTQRPKWAAQVLDLMRVVYLAGLVIWLLYVVLNFRDVMRVFRREFRNVFRL